MKKLFFSFLLLATLTGVALAQTGSPQGSNYKKKTTKTGQSAVSKKVGVKDKDAAIESNTGNGSGMNSTTGADSTTTGSGTDSSNAGTSGMDSTSSGATMSTSTDSTKTGKTITTESGTVPDSSAAATSANTAVSGTPANAGASGKKTKETKVKKKD